MAATTLPCGTPLSTGRLLEPAEPTFTRWNLLDRNDAKHRYKFPWMPYADNLCNNLLCETESNALWKSMLATNTDLWFYRDTDQSLHDYNEFVRQECLKKTMLTFVYEISIN